MLSRLPRHLLLVVLVLALVILPGVLLVVRQTGWFHQRMQEAVTRQLAELVDREVAVGPVTGDPLTGLTIDGLAIAEGERLADGAVLTARRVVVNYDFASLISGRLTPIASISVVRIEGASARIIRTRDGRLNLQNLLPPAKKVPPEKRFRGRIIFANSALVYIDYGTYVKTGSMEIRAVDVEGEADLREVTWVVAKLTKARILDGKADNVSAEMAVDLERPYFNLDATLSGVSAAWAYRTFAGAPQASVTGGRVNATGSVYMVATTGRPVVDFSVHAALAGVTARTREFGNQAARLDGSLWAGLAGVRLDDLNVRWADSLYSARGWVHDFASPTVDMQLLSDRARLSPIVNMLPEKSRQGLTIPASGLGSIRASIIGPVDNPDLRLQLALRDGLTVRVRDLGTVQADGLQLAADVVGTAQPVVRATFSGRRLALPTLDLPGDQWPRQIVAGPVGAFKGSVQMCGDEPVAEATLRLPSLRADDLQLANLSTRATLVDGVVRLQDLRAQALGGNLTAEAALRWRDGPLTALVRGRLEGVDLARLDELPLDLKDPVTGAASVDFQAQAVGDRFAGSFGVTAADVGAQGTVINSLSGTVGLEGSSKRGEVEDLRGAGRFTARGVTRDTLQADQAEALVEFQGDALHIASGSMVGPDGTFWARGDVNLNTRALDLEVRGAELAMRPLAYEVGLRDMAGIGYLSGHVTGSPQTPVFSGRLTVFDPEVGQYAFTAMTAQVTLEGNKLRADSLMANRGSMIVSGDATLSNLGSPPEQMPVNALLRGEGLDLAEVARFLDHDWPVSGLAEFSAVVTGTLAKPRAEGELQLASARYDEVVVDSAQVPFVFANDVLYFHDAQARILDALVTAREGSIALTDPPTIQAELEIGDVRLEGLGPLIGSGIPLGGIVSVPHINVSGPLDRLSGAGLVRARQVNLGGETIRDVEANLALERGQIQLQQTTFELAGGKVMLSGRYDYSGTPDTLAAQVDLENTNVPDLIYLALPILQVADERSEEERKATRLALRSYALRLKGDVTGRINLDGPITELVATTNLEGQNLVLDNRKFPDVKGSGRVSKKALEGLSVVMRQGDAQVNIDGDIVFDGPIQAVIEGSGINLAQVRPWIPLDIPYGGTLGFTIDAAGETRRPELTATVDIRNPSFAGVEFDVLVLPPTVVREGAINIDTLILREEEQEIVLNGELPFSWSVPVVEEGRTHQRPGLIPTGEVKLDGKIERTQVAFFLPLIDQYLKARAEPSAVPGAETGFRWATLKSTGEVDSTVSLRGTPADPMLRGHLRVTNASLQPAKWRHPLSGIEANIEFTGSGRENLVQLNTLTAGYDQTTAALTGRMWLDYLDLPRFWENRFDVDLALNAASQGLPGGSTITNLGGGFSLISDVGMQVLRPRDFGFTIGGGRVSMTGQARLNQFQVPLLASNQYDLELKMTPGRVVYRNLMNARTAGELSIKTPSGETEATVTGGFELTDGMIGLTAPGVGTGTLHGLSSRAPSPGLKLTLALGKGMSLRGSGVSAPLDQDTAAVRVTGRPQRPEIHGQIMARRGTTSLPTATLRLEELGVNFVVEPAPGSRTDPVELTARGTISGRAQTSIARPGDTPIRITVDISGSLPDRIVIRGTADPPLAEAQIWQLLGGYPWASLPGMGSGATDVASIVPEQFLAALANAFQLRIFQPIEEELRRALGLSELGITFAFDQPVSVQVGKYVLTNLLVSYERPLGEGAQRYDLRVSYQLPGGLRITYHNDERNVSRIEVGYAFTF